MVRSKLFAVIACALIGLAGPALAAGDADAGKANAKKCSGCHGANGEGKKANPPLAGMGIEAHVAAMQAYKSGARKHKVMEGLAKKLTDQETADLAAYYASLK